MILVREFLKGIYTYKEFRDLFFRNVRKEDLIKYEPMGELFSALSLFLHKYNRLPNKKELLYLSSVIKQKIKNEDKIKFLDETIEYMFSEANEDISYSFLKEEFFKWLREQRLSKVILSLVNSIEKKQIDEATIRDKILSSLRIEEEESELLFYDEDHIDERWDRLQELNKVSLYLSIGNIDDYIKLKTKELFLFGAGTGVGKSIFLANVAANSVKQGKNVLYLTLELDSAIISKRLDGILLGIKYKDFDINTKEIVKKRYKELKQQYPKMGKLLIKEYPPNVLSSFMLAQFLDDLEINYGIKIDVILIDYIGYMRPNSIHVLKSGSLYEIYRNIMVELLQITKEKNLITFAAVQLNREGEKAKKAKSSDLAGGMELSRAADYVVLAKAFETEELEFIDETLFQPDKYKYMKFTIEKNRDGIEGKSFYMRFDREILRFETVDDPEMIEKLENMDKKKKLKKSIEQQSSADILDILGD